MSKHIFSIGQCVRLDARAGVILDPAEVYTIRALLPPLGEELQYRIRNEREKHERVVLERQIKLAEPARGDAQRVNEMARIFDRLS
jgi:hypothetical protein